jgi:potassium efflux system protein
VAFFDNFGESSLNLKLMCFLPNLENRLTTIHGLNSTIDRLFKEAGLEIPFPQRDLNVKFSQDALSIDLEGSRVATLGKAGNDARRQGAA